MRQFYTQQALIKVQATKAGTAAGAQSLYAHYWDFAVRPFATLNPHHILAINRGQQSKLLSVQVFLPESQERSLSVTLGRLIHQQRAQLLRATSGQRVPLMATVEAAIPWTAAIARACQRYLVPAITRELRREATTRAVHRAMTVFANNLKQLLLQAPLSGYRIVGVDPGFTSGIKLAAIDERGQLLGTTIVYLRDFLLAVSQTQIFVQQHGCTLAAIGDGTASYATQQLFATVITNLAVSRPFYYTVVSEAGASVYSASPIARAELPGLGASLAGAVSIARRALDPLSELVKVEPVALGIGMYQHDLTASSLATTLQAVVEDCVSLIGIDCTTLSPHLLQRISGLNSQQVTALFAAIQSGHCRSRADLLTVQGIGPQTFANIAGFLRFPQSLEPLDNTAVHPESYDTAREILSKVGATTAALGAPHLFLQKYQAPLLALFTAPKADLGDPVATTPLVDRAYPTTRNATTPDPAPPLLLPLASQPNWSRAQSLTLAPQLNWLIARSPTTGSLPQWADHGGTARRVGGLTEAVLPVATTRREYRKARETDITPLMVLTLLLQPSFREVSAAPEPSVRLRQQPLYPSELKVGSGPWLGVVRNVVDFGVFIDIGSKTEALLHNSQLNNQKLVLGEVVTVYVYSVDLDKNRTQLSLTRPSGVPRLPSSPAEERHSMAQKKLSSRSPILSIRKKARLV